MRCVTCGQDLLGVGPCCNFQCAALRIRELQEEKDSLIVAALDPHEHFDVDDDHHIQMINNEISGLKAYYNL